MPLVSFVIVMDQLNSTLAACNAYALIEARISQIDASPCFSEHSIALMWA